MSLNVLTWPKFNTIWQIQFPCCLTFTGLNFDHTWYNKCTSRYKEQTNKIHLSNSLFAGEYVNVYRKQPEDPLLNLCIGLAFTHMACQKFSSKKHALLVQVRLSLFFFLIAFFLFFFFIYHVFSECGQSWPSTTFCLVLLFTTLFFSLFCHLFL